MSASTDRRSDRPPSRPEPALIRRPLDHCPVCNSWQLQPIAAVLDESVHFLCGGCNRCWLVELGFVRRVQPATCDRCPQPQRCCAAYAQDHASI
ncbi:MAG: hypothetical protein QOJ71_34 [Actinomycetota bacterium]|nr:hypothetical protein [Actinomycetota bacterium]